MELIECLAGDPTYWEFIGRGKTGELGQRPSFLDEVPDVDDQPRFDSDKLPTEIPDTEDNDDKHQYRNQTNGYMQHDRNTTKSGNKAADVGLQRWNDSPLITGAKLGLYEFVEKILEVYPQSVNLLDAEGKNILQVAIQLGQEKILDTLAWRIAGKNPVLPSRLLYARDEENNTILHYAAEETVKEDEATALQMQHEMQWFEKVQKLVPKDLQYSRNAQEMTAQERFTDKHEKMAKSGKGQLIELGKTCAGLVAAFVFASSFSIPGSSGGETGIFHKVAFKGA
ncbi:hypothetical protein HPP92_014535 [Vanilla planifolia]|uniref:PGG domain-containing protein n=1 Tax=Vanilla planifolia TaxID=51239 RepID=A0A835UT80_VANPL|nr:hypothetical protein HPP92_014535 [Vanilla planifolia]